MLFGAPCASTLALVVGLAVLTLNVARVAGAPPMPGPSTTTTQRGATADKSRLARERADACYRSAFARPSGGKPPQALKGPLDFAKRVDMWLLRNVQGRDFCGQLSPAAIAAEATPGWTKAPQTMGVFKRLSSEQRQRYLQCYEQKRKESERSADQWVPTIGIVQCLHEVTGKFKAAAAGRPMTIRQLRHSIPPADFIEESSAAPGKTKSHLPNSIPQSNTSQAPAFLARVRFWRRGLRQGWG